MRWPVEVNWDVLYRDRAMCRWLIYASRYRGSKGTVVGEAPITDQSATVYLDQGVWWLRVIGGYAGCREEPWEQCRSLHHVKVIGGRQNTPPDLVNARAMPVDPNVGVRVVADPPGPGDVAHRIQVIEGPSGARGKLLQELPAWPEGALFDGARTPTPVLPIEGAGDAAGRTVVLRTISDGGIPGADQVLSLLVPERYPHVPVSLASVVGNVLNNFSTPSTPGPLDLDATYGVRLRRMPAVSDMSTWTKWGTVGAGVLAGMKFAPCAQLGYLQTPEIDLGADAVFVLECWDNLARQDAAGAWADYPVGAMSWFGMYPEDDLARDLESRYPSVGPHWLMREIHTDGTPRQPNLLSRWEYDVSTSTIETPDWKPYVPGQYIRGQYLMVRLVFRRSESVV